MHGDSVSGVLDVVCVAESGRWCVHMLQECTTHVCWGNVMVVNAWVVHHKVQNESRGSAPQSTFSRLHNSLRIDLERRARTEFSLTQ